MYPCELKQQAIQHTLSIRFRAPVQDLPKHFGRVYSSIIHYLEELGEHHTGAAFAAYHNLDMQNLDVEAGFPVLRPLPGKGEIQTSVIPGGMIAVCHYTGPYDGTATAYEELTQFIKLQGYTINGPSYEWYMSGPEVPPQEVKTDLVLPVTLIREKTAV